MSILRPIAVGVALLASGSFSAAQTLDCTCISSKSAGRSYPVIGEISDSSGSVMYSGKTGFIDGKAGTQITAGSQINVGPGGKAQVQIGSDCKLAVAENSEISILQPEGKDGSICVQITEAEFATATLDSGSSTFLQENPNGGGVNNTAVIALGAAAGVVAISCIGWCQGGDGPRPASP